MPDSGVSDKDMQSKNIKGMFCVSRRRAGRGDAGVPRLYKTSLL
jgi:hypothetical protein